MRSGAATTIALFALAMVPWEVLAKVTLVLVFLVFALVPDPVVRVGALGVCAVVFWLDQVRRKFVLPGAAAERSEQSPTEAPALDHTELDKYD